MNEALSPCPFCGRAATQKMTSQGGNHGQDPLDILHVGCASCGVWLSCSNYPGYITAAQKDELVARWNKRAQAAPAAVAGPHVTDAMALAFHSALSDGAIGSDEVEEIKAGLRAALAAAPTTQPAAGRDGEFWPVDKNASRKQLIAQIGQMNFRLTALRQENAGLIKRVAGQAEALQNYHRSHETAPQQEPQQEPSYTAVQLAELVLSDCGHSSNYTPLLDRVAARIDSHVERRLDELRGCLESKPAPQQEAQKEDK